MLLLSGFALGVVSVLLLIVIRDFSPLKVAKVFIAILVVGAVFLIQEYLPNPWRGISSAITTSVPALFWLLCQLAFAFRPKVLTPSGALAAYTFIAPTIGYVAGISDSYLSELVYFFWTLPELGEYLIVALGIWTVAAHWADDLVEARRHMRRVLLIGLGLAVLFVIIPLNTGIVGLWFSYLALAIFGLVCSFYLLQGRRGVFLGIKQGLEEAEGIKDVVPAIAPELQQEAENLKDLMANGFYRTEHLTLKILAEELSMPEYKTRALINQTLGYRNFNDYINQLRIYEAAQRLSTESDTPILNISLDVGYRTLSSFNRAFKEIMLTTPTEYRQSKL